MTRRLTFALVLLLVACGEGDEALSKDEYVERGDRRCEELDAALQAAGTPDTAEELIAALETFESELEAFRTDFFGELTPPEGAEGVHRQFEDFVEESLAIVREAVRRAEGGDVVGAADELASMREPGERLDAVLGDYGFDACAEG